MSDYHGLDPYGRNKRFDGKTLLAVVLSVVFITGSYLLQGILFPAPPQSPASSKPSVVDNSAAPSAALAAPSAVVAGSELKGDAAVAELEATFPKPQSVATYVVSTSVFEATFSNAGGELVSLKLKKHKENEATFDILLPDKEGLRGLAVAFGGAEAAPYRALMNYRPIDAQTVEFYRTIAYLPKGSDTPQAVTFRKRYTFRPDEYMFRLDISLDNSVNQPIGLDADGFAYTLSFGPEIGPSMAKRDPSADFRKFVAFEEGKRREIKPKAGKEAFDKRIQWTGVVGKYFAFVVIPDATQYVVCYEDAMADHRPVKNALSFSRPAIKASNQTDTFYFYAGPKTSAEMSRYDDVRKNGFNRTADRLEETLDGDILGWLEQIMKFFLKLFHNLIPNYGVAIILTTLLVKILLFPLTRKSSEASARMQELQPKMQEIQAKYKGNPQKLNQEMAQFYQKEGFNPLSGCLPLLIQLPIFIAMYNLFNNHFDLRGASFVAGWIPDLSQPEAIVTFPTIELIFGWQLNAIRLLPVLYVASQLLYGKFTQTPQTGANAAQMKMMMYGIPIVFFFVLYNVPSGLLVYWIVSNVLTIGQQIIINDILKKRRAALAAAAPVLIPQGKKPRKK